MYYIIYVSICIQWNDYDKIKDDAKNGANTWKFWVHDILLCFIFIYQRNMVNMNMNESE